MRKLLSSDDLVQIHLIAGYLQSHGVEVKILNEHQGHARSVVSFGKPIYPELWVSPESFEMAAKLVGRYQHEQDSYDSHGDLEWLCRKCKESSPGNFMSCWSCGESK